MDNISTDRVSILGCGWLGKPLATYLMAQGYHVKGSCRSEEKIRQLKMLGIDSFVVDINKRFVTAGFLDSDILIIAITSKEIEDFRFLIETIETSSIQNVIFISSTSVYKTTNDVVTEDNPNDIGSSPLVAIEDLFRTSKSFQTTIIRFAGLFGYSRKPGNFFSSGNKVPAANMPVNMIHRDDCIAILYELIKQNVWNETFNACADSHPTKREFYTNAAQLIGNPIPDFNEEEVDYKIISNKKLIQRLQYQIKHNDLLHLTTE